VKGFVPTPNNVVDLMVTKLFHGANPSPEDTILDPGCGTGAFIEGIIRWCEKKSLPLPKIIGIESDLRHISEAREKFKAFPSVEIRHEDFLTAKHGKFNYIVGNPPYVPITQLSEVEKNLYRTLFKTAHNRFDLYILFFEQAMESLKKNGRLVFITPEKFLYVSTASPLRQLLSQKYIAEIHLVDEQTFGDLTTYPTITTVINKPSKLATRVIFRDGRKVNVTLPKDGVSWLPAVHKIGNFQDGNKLSDVTVRISCGVATGADVVFVKKATDVDTELLSYAYPTISGRQLSTTNLFPHTCDLMLIPYTKDGRLIPEGELKDLSEYLNRPQNLEKLKGRTCVARKPWYAFHENPPLSEILRPKILCKDITAKPHFWIDKEGTIVPRHSVYYIVPKRDDDLESLCKYLNSDEVREWLEVHCQRAAHSFLRLQSSILKSIPLPTDLYNDLVLKNKDENFFNPKKKMIRSPNCLFCITEV